MLQTLVQRCARFAQGFHTEKKILENRKRLRVYSVLKDPLPGRSAHTKCGMYFLGLPLAAFLCVSARRLAALLGRLALPPRVWALG